jgi:hypothetical protein
LAQARQTLSRQGGDQVIIEGIFPGQTTADLIDTLDGQLANGLGAGTGIEDAKAAMRHILRQRKAEGKH